MKEFLGVSASEGLAVGVVHRIRHMPAGQGRVVRSPQEEQAAFAQAVQAAKEQLEQLEARADARDRDIFLVQRVLLDDRGLWAEVEGYIRAGAGAAAAVERAGGIFAARIRALEDAYMRERACDVLDACRRVVKVLDGQPHEPLQLSAPTILVAEEVYPTDIVSLDRRLLLGFVSSAGSPNAHASIIARTMGIPAVVMAGSELLDACDNRIMALNGGTGEILVDPDEATKARFAHRLRLMRRSTLTQERLRAVPCQTKDGTRIALYADCLSVEDVRIAVSQGADGVGMLPTEYMLTAGSLQTEEDQYQFYSQCLLAAQGRPVTIGVYGGGESDAGPEAPNPALGLCGIRYSLAHPALLEVQLCALLRAGLAGELRILMPMVSVPEELDMALDAVYRAKCSLRARGIPFAETVPVGVAIETPAAALMADELARRAAFFTLETGNLAQYAYAADRRNPAVCAYLPAYPQALNKLVQHTVQAATAAHITLCICGDGASQPIFAENFVRMGVRAFSMPARDLLEVKEALMEMSL